MPLRSPSALGLTMLLVSFAALAQLAPPPGEADLIERGLKPVDEAALRALVSSHTLYHTNTATGQTYPIFYREDGRRFLKIGSNVRPSKWWFKDGLRCDESAAGGNTICFKIFDDAGVLRACSVGAKSCEWIFTAVRGDAEGIGK
jgi:hypothetical protein